jgi:hypothetical protein
LRTTVYYDTLKRKQLANPKTDDASYAKVFRRVYTFALGVLLTRAKQPKKRTTQCVWAVSTTQFTKNAAEYRAILKDGKAWAGSRGVKGISPQAVRGEERWHAEAQIIQYAKNGNLNVCYIVVDRPPCHEGSAPEGSKPPNTYCEARVNELKQNPKNTCFGRSFRLVILP